MGAQQRTCTICTQIIAPDAAITICTGCGTIYHDACYQSEADCRVQSCPARTASPMPADPAGGSYVETPSHDVAASQVKTVEVTLPVLERQALPNRVKSGELRDECLTFDTSAGRAQIAWSRVELITLGIIEEFVGDQQHQKSGLRNMLRKLFFGESQADNSQFRKIRDVYLMDIFVTEQRQPYRIDGSSVNYRSFLGEVSYASARNLQRLVATIVHRSMQSRLDASMVAFLTGQRDRVKRFTGVYDFELESFQNRERPETLTARRDLKAELGRQMAADVPISSEEYLAGVRKSEEQS